MRLVMTHAPHFPAGMMHVQLSAAVLDDGRFVASASSAHSRIAAIVAGSSIATTVSLSPDTPCCSSAPSDALVETPFRIPSTDTLGFAAAALAASCLACYPVVDSVDELLDLDQGSWEGSLPDSSSLGEDGTPLRGAFIIDSASLTGFQELTAGKTLSILREWRILIAIDLRQPGPLWSAKLAQSYAAADTCMRRTRALGGWEASTNQVQRSLTAICDANPRGRHLAPMRLTNTPLWLYLRSVRSSEKLVKL